MGIETEYEDVLQSIESKVVRTFRAHPAMTDYAAMRAYETLIDHYRSEQAGRPPTPWDPTPVEAEVFEAVRGVCDGRLGHHPMTDAKGKELESPPAITVDELTACLKRLLKSARKWNDSGGRQGYLTFIAPFLP